VEIVDDRRLEPALGRDRIVLDRAVENLPEAELDALV
jgi:hypothetical protein